EQAKERAAPAPHVEDVAQAAIAEHFVEGLRELRLRPGSTPAWPEHRVLQYGAGTLATQCLHGRAVRGHGRIGATEQGTQVEAQPSLQRRRRKPVIHAAAFAQVL